MKDEPVRRSAKMQEELYMVPTAFMHSRRNTGLAHHVLGFSGTQWLHLCGRHLSLGDISSQ